MSKSGPAARDVAGEILDDCIAGRTRLLSRVITAIYDDALRPLGLRNTQLTILAIIARLGSTRAMALEHYLQADRSTISRNLKRMRDRGWVRTLPGSDARTHRVALTSQGQELLGEALPVWRRAQDDARRKLGAGRSEGLVAAADKLLEALMRELPPEGS